MNAKDLVDSPVYDLKTKACIGEVKSLLVDFETQKVKFFLMETEDEAETHDFRVSILRFQDLQKSGDEDQILVDPAQMRQITREDIFDMLFSDVISILGLDLYVANKRIGPLEDYSMDPKTGLIVSVTVQSKGTALSIEIGKDLTYMDGRIYLDPLAQMS